MKNKKLMARLAEDLIQDSNKENVFERIQMTLSSNEHLTSGNMSNKLRLIVIFVSLALSIILSVSYIIKIIPETILQPINNNPTEIPSPSPSPSIPIHYGNEDLEIVESTLENLESVYSKQLNINGYRADLINLYQTKDDNRIPVYILIRYVRESLDDAPWDFDVITLTIVLINNYNYEYDEYYTDQYLDLTMDVTIDNQQKPIKYNEQGDMGDGDWDGFNQAKTKFVLNDIIYYVDINYFALTEEGNRLKAIIEQIL